MSNTCTLFSAIFISMLFSSQPGYSHHEGFPVSMEVPFINSPVSSYNHNVIHTYLPDEIFSVTKKGEQTDPPKAKILILGTYHFANPGLDVVKTEVPDILHPEQQEQLMRVFESLKPFKPSKIAVEHVPESAPFLDSIYQAYLSENHTLSKNETQQLGFRLAREFHHSRVYPIDHKGSFPFDAVISYAMKNDPGFLALMQQTIAEITEEINRRHREWTIGKILRQMNTPDELIQSHGFYLEINRVGAGDNQVGSDLLSQWYDRNIRIFSNLQALAKGGDHIIVIIGAGHAHILSELVRSDPKMELVDPLPFLPIH